MPAEALWPDAPLPISAILREQASIITRAQLRDLGVSRGAERAHLEARRWRALNDVVICAHNGPLTASQAAWATVLSAQGPTALCGLSAMQAWGITGFAIPAVHVIVIRGARDPHLRNHHGGSRVTALHSR